MDFLLALKGNEPALALLNLKKVLIAFALLGNREYVELILQQLLLFEYHQLTEHPHVEVFKHLLQLLVGEDIELGNRALSHASIRNSRRSEHEQLNKAYRLLRFLRLSGVQFGEDMTEYRNIVKGSRRYDVTEVNALEVIEKFFKGILTDFEDDQFTHYKIPFKYQKTSQRIPPPDSKEERKHITILHLRSANIDSMLHASPEKELMEVPYAGAYDWMYFLKVCMKHIFSKRGDIATKLKVETLDYILEKAPTYASTSLKTYIHERKQSSKPKRKSGPRLHLESE
jgi:hypothetical protein